MVIDILKKIKLARKQVKFAQSFEEMLKKKLEQKQKEQELHKQEKSLEKAQRKTEKQDEGEYIFLDVKDPETGKWGKRRVKKPKKVEDRTIEEHADATHKSLEQQYNRDKWKETLKKNLVLLEEGHHDSQIHEIKHMLMTIVNQPGNTMEIRRDKNFASSILGSDLSKKASFADELEKAKRLKEKKQRPDLITKKDLSKEELESLQQNISSREDEKRPSHYVGWKRETPEGKVIYKLSGAQLKLVLDLYEKALQRGLEPQKKEYSPKIKLPTYKLPELLKPKKKEEPLLSDEDAGDLDLSDFGKVSSIQKAKFAIKKAQDMLTRKK